jgi:dolichol-phosphate mannosyltransferase
MTQNAAVGPDISVVSPVFLGAAALDALVREIDAAVADLGLSHEIVLVDDGSPDDSWRSIVALCARFRHVKGVRLSRNFGQHYAITAGLEAASGERIIVMDCDLQDDPKYIPELYAKSLEGYEIVYTIKQERKHTGWKDLLSRAFHWVVNVLVTDKRQRTIANVGNYSLVSRAAVDAFLKVNDYHRHYLGLMRWIGFRSTSIVTEHRARVHGETSYTLWKLVREAINAITSQSDRLLYASILLGFTFMATALLSAAYIVVRYFVSGFREGWASVMVLMLLSTGVVLLCLGVVGIYLGKIFEQTKLRPLYFVHERLNFDESEGARGAAHRLEAMDVGARRAR